MTKNIYNWIKDIWDSAAPTGDLAAGQVWAVFAPSGDQENKTERGTIVLVLDIEEECAFVVPAHHESNIRTFVDPVLSFENKEMDFEDRLVCVAHLPQRINFDAFCKAKYLGNVTVKGYKKVQSAVNAFFEILDELACIQYSEATDSIDPVSLEKAFESGILKIYPITVSLEKLNELDTKLMRNLSGWQNQFSLETSPDQEDDGDLTNSEDKKNIVYIDSSRWEKQKTIFAPLKKHVDHLIGDASELSPRQLNKEEEKLRNTIIESHVSDLAQLLVYTASNDEDFRLAHSILEKTIINHPENDHFAVLYLLTCRALKIKNPAPLPAVVRNMDKSLEEQWANGAVVHGDFQQNETEK